MSQRGQVSAQRVPPPADPMLAPQPPRLPSLIWPLSLLTAGLIAIILVVLLFAAREQNRLALEASLHLAHSALQSEARALVNSTRDYATWDDAVDNLVLTLNRSWADDNIGSWVNENLGVSATVVVDGRGDPIYAMVNGETAGEEVTWRVTSGLGSLAAAAREADPEMPDSVVSGYVVVDGLIAIAAAAPITWDDHRPVTARGDAANVLVFLRTLDRARLASLAEDFLLPDLHLARGEADLHSAVLPIEGYAGDTLGYLTWEAEQPGFAMLQALIAPGALAGAVALALLAITIVRAGHAMEQLESSHVTLHRQALALENARDQAEQQRLKAVDANRSKSEFLAMMSHELRTPLNAILGFSETIAKQSFGSAASERYRDYAQDIHDSGTHLLSIINDILDLSKVEAGRYELHEEEVALGECLQRCIALLREKACEKSLKVSCEAAEISLHADVRAIKQIVINLLSNAIKFTPEGGRISVTATHSAAGVEIAVADNGIGMNEEELARALLPFGQAGSALTRSIEGSGLGLNVVQALARLHGGDIEIRSTPGKGTTVTVQLPPSRVLPAETPALTA